VDDELFEKYDTHSRVESIQQVKLVATTIVNSIAEKVLHGISDKYGKQPYLAKGWEVRKMRFAIDRGGKQNGLRIIFCIDNQLSNILLVLISRKADCADEQDLQDEFFSRVDHYLNA
jgi:hypothetical protein